MVAPFFNQKSIDAFGFSLLLVSLFPYISVTSTAYSMQPYPVIFGLLYLIRYQLWGAKFPAPIFLSLIPMVAGFIFAIIFFSENALRSLYNYLSFSLLLFCYLHILRVSYVHHVLKVIGIVSMVYIMVGVVQRFFDPNIVDCCVANIADNRVMLQSGRGVTSLTPEPTFYGFMCLCFYIIFSMSGYLKLALINLGALILISNSSLAILCLALYLFFRLLTRSESKVLLVVVAALALIVVYELYSSRAINLRIFALVDMIFQNGLSAFVLDDSAAGRLYHIVQPWVSFFEGFGLPNLFNGLPNGDTRILSGIGSGVYELGFAFLPILALFVWVALKSRRGLYFSVMLVLMVMWFNANQIGFPVLVMLFSFLIHYATLPSAGRGKWLLAPKS